MSGHFHLYRTASPDAEEIFISALPDPTGSMEARARSVFSQIADTLRARRAHLFQERVFADPSVLDQVCKIRSDCYGALDDGVRPSLLCGTPGQSAAFAGVQLHAVAGTQAPRVIIGPEGRAVGRTVASKRCTFVSLSALTADHSRSPRDQAYGMFTRAEEILESIGSSFLCVPRTWLWLKNILSWYGDLNEARTTFFREIGILGACNHSPMPASTGIGLSPPNGHACAMDLTAVLAPTGNGTIRYHQAGGLQESAYRYGSAFSRASQSLTPAGQTVFVSGTASIDAAGRTTHGDDAKGQIQETLLNVGAILRDMACREEDVVLAVAYCKSEAYETLFRTLQDKPAWPWIPIVCDICRDDLLFEVEVTAMPTPDRR